MPSERQLLLDLERATAAADELWEEVSEAIADGGLPARQQLRRYVELRRRQLAAATAVRDSVRADYDAGPVARMLAGALELEALAATGTGEADAGAALKAEAAELRRRHPDTSGPLDVEAFVAGGEAHRDALLAEQELFAAVDRALVRHREALAAGDAEGALAAAGELAATVEPAYAAAVEREARGEDAPGSAGAASLAQLLFRALTMQATGLGTEGGGEPGLALLERALELAERHLDLAERAEVLASLGDHHLRAGRFHQALEVLEGRRDLFREAGDERGAAAAALALAKAWSFLGDHQRVERTLAPLGRPQPAASWGEWERAMAALDEEQGVLAAEATRLTAASDPGALLEAEGPDARRRAREDFGEELEATLDLKERFERHAERRRQHDAGLGRDFEALELASLRAKAARARGRWDEALAGLEVAADFWGDSDPGVVTRLHIAGVRVQQGDFARGEAEAATCERRLEASDAARIRAPDARRVRAEALLRRGEAAAALALLERVRAELPERPTESWWRAEALRAEALAAVGRGADALAAYEGAAAAVDAQRKASLGYRLDSTFVADKLPLFDGGIRLAAELGEARRAAVLMEKVKARALAATLSVAGVEAPAAGELAARIDELSRRGDALEYEAFASPDGWTAERARRHRELRSERSALLERQRQSDPRWRALSAPPAFDPEGLAARLRLRDQAAIALYLSGETLVAVLARGDGWRVEIRPVGPALAALERYTGNLEARDPERALYDPRAVGLTAESFFSRQLLAEAVAASSLVLVPHGRLHLLPWAGLELDGDRLFERVPVGVLPSLSTLAALAGSFPSRPAIALLGAHDYSHLPRLADLKGVRREVRAVAPLYDRRLAEPVTGTAATEAAFLELARHPEAGGAILHAACHGIFSAGEPLDSGLLLYDGKVDAAELRRLRLAYDEVVLSACSTAYRPTAVGGVELAGDDIVGLPGSLLEAGASSVLVSIPPAADAATRELMVLYHRQRARGVTPLAALQAAQEQMLASRFPVADWIGFTVYGAR